MPKLLWISPFSLHDNLSSQAVNCKLLLYSLVDIGWKVYVCSALNGRECDELSLVDMRQKYGTYGQRAITFYEDEINFVYTCCKTTNESKMSLSDMQIFYDMCCGMMDLFSPDFVMGTGFNLGMVNCFAEAKRRGCWTIFMLLDACYFKYNFPHIDLILTNSRDNALLYYDRYKINAIPIGEVFVSEKSIARKDKPKYITFVDPSFGSGVAIFAKIALVFQQIDPNQRFLVVNRHQQFDTVIRRLKLETNDELEHIDYASYFATDLTPPQDPSDDEDTIAEYQPPQASQDPTRSKKNINQFHHRLASFDFTDVHSLNYEEEKHGNFKSLDPLDFSNIDLTEPDIDLLQVYAQTKVLLIPTLTWEAWGRVATEGILNKIPVVASNSGGLQEATFGAGLHIMPPSRLQHKLNILPSNAEIKPWIDAINHALHDDFSERFKQALQKQILEDTIERFQEAIATLMHQQLHSRILFNRPDQWLGYIYPKYGMMRPDLKANQRIQGM